MGDDEHHCDWRSILLLLYDHAWHMKYLYSAQCWTQIQYLANYENWIEHETMLFKIRNIVLMWTSEEAPCKGKLWHSRLPLSPYSCIPHQPANIACHLFHIMTTNMYVNRMAGWLEKIQERTLGRKFQQHEDMWTGFIHKVSFCKIILDMSYYITNSGFCKHERSAHFPSWYASTCHPWI